MSEDEGTEERVPGFWKKLPGMLQRAVAYGLMAGVAMGVVVFVFLAFEPFTNYVKEKLGIHEDLARVENAVQVSTEDQLNAAIEFTSGRMIDSAQQRMRHENDSLFAKVSEDLIEPGINKLNRLEENVRYLNKLLNVSNDLLIQQTNANRLNADRLSQMQQQMNGSGNDQKQDAILRKLEEMQATIDEMKKTRTSKQKF